MPPKVVTFEARINRKSRTIRIPDKYLEALPRDRINVVITCQVPGNRRGARKLTPKEFMASKLEIVRLYDEESLDFTRIAEMLEIKEATTRQYYTETKAILDEHPHSVALHLSPTAVKAISIWANGEEHTHMDDLNSMIRADGTWRIKLLSIDRVGAEVIGEIEEFAECQGIEIGESKKKGSLTGLTIKTIEAIESALGKRIRKFSEINGTETRMKLLQALPPQTASELTEFLELKKLGPAKYRKERSLD